jgi:hypothetical protein
VSVSRVTSRYWAIVDYLPLHDTRRILADVGFSMLFTLPLAPHQSLLATRYLSASGHPAVSPATTTFARRLQPKPSRISNRPIVTARPPRHPCHLRPSPCSPSRPPTPNSSHPNHRFCPLLLSLCSLPANLSTVTPFPRPVHRPPAPSQITPGTGTTHPL